MALLDKLDDLRGKATEMMQSGVAIAKLKTDNMADEDAMRRAYLAIGKMYFELYGDAPDAALATECERIRACQLRIAENNLRLAQMKDDIMESATDAAEEPVKTAPAESAQPEEVPFEKEEVPITEEAPKQPDTVPEEKEELPLDEMK